MSPVIASVKNSVSADNDINEFSGDIYYIAIVGGGPKGLYGLGRLAAQLKAHPISAKVEIHMFNRTTFFGSGDVYRSDQPQYLKMNISAAEVDMWLKESPEPVVREALDFSEWLEHQPEKKKEISEDNFPSRALVGSYLEAGYESIKKNLPDNMAVREFVGEVTDLERAANKYRIRFKGPAFYEEFLVYAYDRILLATGHPPKQISEQEKEYIRLTKSEENAGFIPFIYPTEKKLAGISSNSRVGIKGIGLTFVDAVLALTEGRGGKFIHDDHSRYIYIPSGNEPAKIYPFSRKGLPMISRTADPQAKKANLHYFNSETIDALKRKKNKPLDFEKDLWPLIKQDIISAYYSATFENHDFFVEESWKNVQKFEKEKERFHNEFPEAEKFSIEDYLDPLSEKQFFCGEELHHFIKEYIKNSNREAEKNPEESAQAAISRVWNTMTPFFGEIISFGGISPSSHKIFNEQYKGMLNRITFGPPVTNMKKIVALAESGMVDFSIGPCTSVSFSEEKGNFSISSGITQKNTEVNYLVDARIPKVSIAEAKEGLYRNLLDRGEIILFENTCEDSDENFAPGCLCINKDGYVVTSKGEINTSIAVTGTPTEGITFDNDALSPARNNFVSGWAAQVRSEMVSKSTDNNG